MILFHFLFKYLKRNKIAVVIELEPSSFSVEFIVNPFVTTSTDELEIIIAYTNFWIMHISLCQWNLMMNDFSDSTTHFA